jgi:hypothetical protein
MSVSRNLDPDEPDRVTSCLIGVSGTETKAARAKAWRPIACGSWMVPRDYSRGRLLCDVRGQSSWRPSAEGARRLLPHLVTTGLDTVKFGRPEPSSVSAAVIHNWRRLLTTGSR